MERKSGSMLLGMAILAIILVSHSDSYSQYLFSALASGQSAYLASSEEGFSFAANPAYLGYGVSKKRFRLILEGDVFKLHGNNVPFHPAFPDLELWYRLTSRLTLGLRKQYFIDWPEAVLKLRRRDSVQIPLPTSTNSPYQYQTGFSFIQGWSYGAGYNVRSNCSLGIAVRHIEIASYFSHDEYLTADIGSYWNPAGRLKIATVLRNMVQKRIENGAFDYRIMSLATGEVRTVAWDISDFGTIFTRPERYLEFGCSYMLGRTLEMLLDYSSRKEYAWGLRLHFSRGFAIHGGSLSRYDQIYRPKRMFASTVGFMARYKFVALTLSGVFSASSTAGYADDDNVYGLWRVSRTNPDTGLLSLSFVF